MSLKKEKKRNFSLVKVVDQMINLKTLMNLTNLDLESVLLCLKCNTLGFMQLL